MKVLKKVNVYLFSQPFHHMDNAVIILMILLNSESYLFSLTLFSR